MAVKSKDHIAICGRSGSGKTSLILCILKMMSIQEGRIKIDGIDLSTMDHESLRGAINVVPQDPFLMPGTIRFNIDPLGLVADEDVIRALNRVKLWSIVESQGGLDKEMETSAWSAGQKQLLCLARALTRRSKILILDEAMSRYV